MDTTFPTDRETLQAELEAAGTTFRGTNCRCPFHEDREASGSIFQKDGHWRFKCHGCGKLGDVTDVREWLGTSTPKPRRKDDLPKTVRSWPTRDGAIECVRAGLERDRGTATIGGIWDYRTATGELFAHMVRFNLPDKGDGKRLKTFRPVRPVPGGFAIGDPVGKFPLYRLPQLAGAARVYVCEGEKAADAAASCGLIATTSAHGAGATDKTDWKALAHVREVVILPDNDDAGEKYAADVAKQVRAANVGCTVKVLRLPGLPEKGDFYEFANELRDGQSAEAIHAEVTALADATPALAEEETGTRPIPLDSPAPVAMEASMFPGWLGDFIAAVSKATETPVELAAGMAIGVLATVCQGTFTANPEPGYFEPLPAWPLTLLPPGNRKSEVVRRCCKPLIMYEQMMAANLKPTIEKIQSENATIQARLKELRSKAAKAETAEFERMKGEIAELEAQIQEEPKPPRLICDDITPEHLGTLMDGNGGRMGILSDEAGIFGQIAGRYSANGQANFDLFLKGHAGNMVRVDRGSRPPVMITHALLTMAIAAQPELLRSLRNRPDFRGYGLLGRFWYLYPPSPLGFRSLIAHPVPKSVEDAYTNGIGYLLAIPPVKEEGHAARPHVIGFSPEAWGRWKQHAREVEVQLRPGQRFEHMNDWAGKFPGAIARIATLLHCAEHAHDGPQHHLISEDTMLSAIAIGEVLASHALAAFDLMGADEGLEAARRIWAWVEAGRLTTFTARDAWHPLRGTYKHAADIEPGFAVLIERGWIAEEDADQGRKGRPSRSFTVNPLVVREWGN